MKHSFSSISASTLRWLVLFGLLLSVATGYMQPAISQMTEPAATETTATETETTANTETTGIDNTTTQNETEDLAEEPANDEDTAETAEAVEEDAIETDAIDEDAIETEDTAEAAKPAEPAITASERIRRKLLIQADSEYEAGNVAEAQALYQQAKDETWLLPRQFSNLPPAPFSDETLLRPGAAVYWREGQAGVNNQRPSQAMSALSLLTSEYPEFVPGTVLYASVLQAEGDLEAANTAIEAALTLYPDNTELLLAQVDLMMSQEQWLEAAIASRQFVALNPDHIATPQQSELAAENLSRFQDETKETIRNGAIANLFTGVLGYAFTGSIFGPFTAANSAILLMQGENAVGAQFANQVEQQLPMLQHPEAKGYVRRMGARLAAATGRRDLDYEFYVILDPNLNAFALPGGKIFVNAGAILDTRSEAELAGLLSHELSHSVLSHGFQLATQGNLTSSVAQYLPYGGLINNVFMSGYSRKMERQADIVGTQILASSGYAADGVYNVMVTLNEQAAGRNVPTWISSHPNPADRVDYLKTLVERGGYNRYAYEGVASHEEIQAIVARELAAYEAEQAARYGGNVEEAVEEAVEERHGEARHGEERRGEEPQNNLYEAVERFDW